MRKAATIGKPTDCAKEMPTTSIIAAIEQVLSEEALRTPDLGGLADTKTCGAAIADAVSEGS